MKLLEARPTWHISRGRRLPEEAYIAGLPVHVVVGTFQRLPIFGNHRLAKAVFAPLRHHPSTLAACSMPDHLHWLIQRRGFVAQVQRMKSYTTKLARDEGHRRKLWQRSFHDQVVRSSEGARSAAE